MNYFKLVVLFSFLAISCSTEKKENIKEKSKDESSNMVVAELELKIDAQLGEGAFWNHQTQELFWVDIIGEKLHIYNPKTKINKSFQTNSMIGTVVPTANQSAVIALVDGIYMINTVNGEHTKISEIENNVSENRFNDGKCDPNGNLWVGSMNLKNTHPSGNVYKVNKNGDTEKMIDSVTISNGIVWTKNHQTMYYIDTPTGQIVAYDFDKSTSTISNKRVVVEVPESVGYPDGMTIDEEDMLWVGLWNGNGVGRFNPNTGKMISKIEVPAHNVTACAFGGENLDVLYITTAREDMTNEEIEKYPNAGSVFKVSPGVKGVKSTLFGN